LVDIHYFAAARAARGQSTETVDAGANGLVTLADLVETLGREHTEHRAAGLTLAEVFGRCTFLADGRRAEPSAPLANVERIDIMPPFAGG
jgi:molybdopterin synthase sulfur carrier subunit